MHNNEKKNSAPAFISGHDYVDVKAVKHLGIQIYLESIMNITFGVMMWEGS